MTTIVPKRPDRASRELRRGIVKGSETVPVMLDGGNVCAALGIASRQLNNLVRKGVLEDHTLIGERAFFRATEVREYLLSGSKFKGAKIKGLQIALSAETGQTRG